MKNLTELLTINNLVGTAIGVFTLSCVFQAVSLGNDVEHQLAGLGFAFLALLGTLALTNKRYALW